MMTIDAQLLTAQRDFKLAVMCKDYKAAQSQFDAMKKFFAKRQKQVKAQRLPKDLYRKFFGGEVSQWIA